MTHLVGVRITNFGPFRGEHELELGPGCYGVLATHADDPRRSNGCGKTFFTGAIRWALDGIKVEGKRTLDELITDGEDSASVELEFSDGVYLSRRRERGRASRLELVVVSRDAGEKTLKDDEAQIYLNDHVLGVEQKDRESTCWALQKELDSMLREDATPMMERWLGDELERLKVAGECVSGDLLSSKLAHQRAVAELEQLQNSKGDINALTAEVEKRHAELDADEAAFEHYLEAAKKYERRKNVTERAAELERVGRELRETNSNAGTLPALEKLRTEAQEHRDEFAKAQTETQRARSERARLEKLASGEFDGVCPVSRGFACPARAEINSRSEPNRKSFEEATRNLKVALAAESSVGGECQEATARLSHAERLHAERARADGRKSALEERLVELQDYLTLAKNDGILPLGENETPPEKHVRPSDGPLLRAQTALGAARAVETALPLARQAVEITAVTLRAHVLAAEVLQAARRLLLRASVAGIEQEANERLSSAGVPLVVRAEWGRETKELAEQCASCGSAFPRSAKVKRCEGCGAPRGPKITDEFRWRSSWTSGAWLDFAGFALRVAAFRFLKERRGALWSVAVLDEPTAQMDEANRRSVAAHLRQLLVGTFEQAFITAHDPSTLESCDKKILITGAGDPVRSRIEVV